jgi:hypothetical protein
LRGLLPYPDPARRRRVRRAASRLVVYEPWSADDATMGRDAAQLALLRILWLQKQTRRAACSRQREAAALLARSALEACILGLYCLHAEDPVADLRAAYLKATGQMLDYLTADGFIPRDVMDQALRAFGTPKQGPTVKAMAELVDAQTGGTVAADLYRRLYAPTSTFFVHANTASLLRHVDTHSALSARPSFPWARRSAVRLADACVGILAAAIANDGGTPTAGFVSYAEAHVKRVIMPVAITAGKGVVRLGGLAQFRGMLHDARDLRDYLFSAQAANDPPHMREVRVRVLINKFAATVVDADTPAGVVQPIADYLVQKILSETERPDA